MIGEIQLLDVYAPAVLVWAVVAGLLLIATRRLLHRAGLYRLVWHRGLFDLALFCLLWVGLNALGNIAVRP